MAVSLWFSCLIMISRFSVEEKLPYFQSKLNQYTIRKILNNYSPVQVKIFVSVYIDSDSDRDSVRDRDKNNREMNYIDRVRDAK